MRRVWIYPVLLIALLASQVYREAQAASQPSDSDWAKILASNGFSDQGKLLIGLEIMFAESGGNCNGPNSSAGARGCWQFMVDTLADETCVHDPVCSTKSAYTTSKQATDWGKWEAFTNGSYLKQEKRARAAIAAAAPGCDWVSDAGCFLKMAWNGPSVGIPNVGAPSLSNASPLDILDIWTKIPFDQVGDFGSRVSAYMLGGIDLALLHSFESMWHATVGGEDNLGGQTYWSGFLMVDTTPVFKWWAFMVGVCSTGLAVFLFMTGNILALFRREPLHDLWRNCVWLVIGVVGMAVSFWLMQAVIGLSNAFTNTINAQQVLELRSLPVYQDLASQKFSVETITKDHFLALLEAVGILIIGIEMALLFFVYIVRAIKLWVLAVLVPLAIAAGFIPQGRGITVWWVRQYLATLLIKPINALIFALFLSLGVTAQGFVNVLVMIALLWIMWLVPGWIKEALSEQHITSAHTRIHALVASQGVGKAVGFVAGKLSSAA